MAVDRDELTACYRRLEKPVYNVLYRHLWDSHMAMDVLHEAFMRVWRKRRRVDPEGLDALLWTTALNLTRNELRRRTRWGWLPLAGTEAAGSGNPQAAAELDERDRHLARALARLPADQRDALLLSVYAGLDRQTLAQVLGIPAGTVASRRHQAEQRLKTWLETDD